MPAALREMSPQELALRLAEASADPSRCYAFLLGAGCSVSSGIPTSERLVRDVWLPRLARLKDEPMEEGEEWERRVLPDWDPTRPELAWGPAIDALFLSPGERLRELERLVDRVLPAFGHAVLATMMLREGGHFDLAFTSNFDDLVTDALYLHTGAHPRIVHEAAWFSGLRPTPNRPLVVKLGGDRRLEPHAVAEADPERLASLVGSLLQDRGLLVMGHGGHEERILAALEALPSHAMPWGVYWLNPAPPPPRFGSWLKGRQGFWVPVEFDPMMLLLQDALNLGHPGRRSYDRVQERYVEHFDRVVAAVRALPADSPESSAMRRAADNAEQRIVDWWSVEHEARRFKNTDPARAHRIYEDGLRRFPFSAQLMGNYALFVADVLLDPDRAEVLYRRAIELDPQGSNNLANYARFQWEVRNDTTLAEQFYRRALDADGLDTAAMGNFASFLANVRGDLDQAELLFRRSVHLDPQGATNLHNFAIFLWKHRGRPDEAEDMFVRSIEVDPKSAVHLHNLAMFHWQERGREDEAEAFFRRSIAADEAFAHCLGNYAVFLDEVKKRPDEAETFFRRALAADPHDLDHQGNFAGFLLARGRGSEGLSRLSHLLKRPLDELSDALAVELHFYAVAHLPHRKRGFYLGRLKSLLRRGIRSPGWNFHLHLERVRKSNPQDLVWLERLAAVVSDRSPLDVLESWVAWREAVDDGEAEPEDGQG